MVSRRDRGHYPTRYVPFTADRAHMTHKDIRRITATHLSVLFAALALTACATGPARTTTTAAAVSDGRGTVAGVAAANPMAVDAGLAALEAGGSAVDAAVAVQAMLGLVEPQSSGIGGGGFLMYFEARTGRVFVFDGRETAPAGASPTMFLDATGTPLPFDTAVVSGLAVGTPGVMPMLGMAHARFGRSAWSSLFGEAIATAERGFPVPRRLARFAAGSSAQAAQPDVRAMFAGRDGGTVRQGDTLRNPAYAATLRALASRGPRALHEGPIAAAIAARVQAGHRPGSMTVADLAAYQPVEREALCAPYREYTICVPPPPSSGVSMLQLLAMLEQTDIATRNQDDASAWFTFAEASRLMYADRDQYIADPAFVDVPVRALLDPAYVRARAALIGPSAGPAPSAGAVMAAPRGNDSTIEAAGTSHFVIIDFEGNAVSMTTTVESVFGSGHAVGGFLLNNQLTDFSMLPSVDGVPVANAVAPLKRPRSSMAPMIVLDRSGRLRGALGSPGGSSILVYNAKAALGALAWRLPVQAAIDLPNLVARGPRFALEAGRLSQGIRDELAARAVVLTIVDSEDSGLHGFLWSASGRLEGGADSRRDGAWRVIRRR